MRPIRFSKGRGYYFAFSKEGIIELLSDRPDMEETSMIDTPGGKGEYVVRDMLEIIAQYDEGFYEYHWTMPGKEGNDHKKNCFCEEIQTI